MRIVGGKYKGLTLATPQAQATRPTSDRVREAIFNIITHSFTGFEIEGCRVLDLFAGTGALGFEALSRGARYCHFVEEASPPRGLIRTNADKLGVIGQCKIWRRDATKLGNCAPLPRFDLIFADPPYDRGLGEQALSSLVTGDWLEPGALVILEESDRAIIGDVKGLDMVDTRDYGETRVRFYQLSTPK